MAALRNTAINIIRLRGGTNIAAAHRDFSYHPPTSSTPSPQPDQCLDRHAHQAVHDFARALDYPG
jgi:hypothetical protein